MTSLKERSVTCNTHFVLKEPLYNSFMTLESLTLQTPYLSLDTDFYDICSSTKLDNPYLIHLNQTMLETLDIEITNEAEFVALLNGTFELKGSKKFAMCYAGHQFGHYAPRLGDGRAIHLGKIAEHNLQLKGAGETIYARMADGRTTLASSIREYLMSEAMYHLGIPTTRAVGIIGSETDLLRDNIEKAAIVLRSASSWVRFGSFEFFYYTKEYDKLEQLAEYVIQESYPHLQNEENRYEKLFSAIVTKSAELVAKWQAFGFTHGVINTDNMSVAGLTLDYGPFGMLDDYNFSYVSNKKDAIGRYSYGAQPNIVYWNIEKLMQTFTPLVAKATLQKIVDAYGSELYPQAYIRLMRQKMGLLLEVDEDIYLIEELVGALQDAYVDYTLFFRTLSHYDGDRTPLYDIAMNPIAIDNWLKLYDKRLAKEEQNSADRHTMMRAHNPKYVLKNYLLEKAIKAAKKGDFSLVNTLHTLAQNPFDEQERYEAYACETPETSKNLQLTCAS